MAEIAEGIKRTETVTRNVVSNLPAVPSALLPAHVVRGPRAFGRRTRHPAVPARDAAAFLGMDTAQRRAFVDLRIGEPVDGGFAWVYVYPLDPAVWYAEHPDKAYPLARMMVLFPGYCPEPAEVRGRLVELHDGKVVMAGHPKASRLLRRPRMIGGGS